MPVSPAEEFELSGGTGALRVDAHQENADEVAAPVRGEDIAPILLPEEPFGHTEENHDAHHAENGEGEYPPKSRPCRTKMKIVKISFFIVSFNSFTSK